MKAIIAVIMMVMAVDVNAATRNIVPRATNEGGIGTASKIWNVGYFKDATATFGVVAVTGTFSGAITATTLDTGQGANELYDMDQNVLQASEVQFAKITDTGAAYLNEALYVGPALHKSTCAATTGNWTIHDTMDILGATTVGGTLGITGALTSNTSIGVPATGMVFVGLRTIAELMAATAVAGQIGICSNCSPVEVFISTAAGAPNTGGYSNAVGLQLD
jgi:hypothetical protein